MPFAIGQKVKCVKPLHGFNKAKDAWATSKGVVFPEVGNIYHVRSVTLYSGLTGITLMEIRNPLVHILQGLPAEPHWLHVHFVPVEENKTSTETGFKILDDIRKKVEVDEPVKKELEKQQ